jgi:hypothetical protein
MHRDPNLLQIIFARHIASGLAGRLNRWQKQLYQNANNRNYDQQFDKAKAVVPLPMLGRETAHNAS